MPRTSKIWELLVPRVSWNSGIFCLICIWLLVKFIHSNSNFLPVVRAIPSLSIWLHWFHRNWSFYLLKNYRIMFILNIQSPLNRYSMLWHSQCTIVSRNVELLVCINYEFHNFIFVEFNIWCKFNVRAKSLGLFDVQDQIHSTLLTLVYSLLQIINKSQVLLQMLLLRVKCRD